MQALSNARQGTYTIQWMFGIPEVLKQLQEWKIDEGKEIRVIRSYKYGVLIGVGSRRFVLDRDVAERIKV